MPELRQKGIDLRIISFNVETMLVHVFILIPYLLLEKCCSPNLNVTGGLTFSSHRGGNDTTCLTTAAQVISFSAICNVSLLNDVAVIKCN